MFLGKLGIEAILHQSDHGHLANLSTVLRDGEADRLDGEAVFSTFPPWMMFMIYTLSSSSSSVQGSLLDCILENIVNYI